MAGSERNGIWRERKYGGKQKIQLEDNILAGSERYGGRREIEKDMAGSESSTASEHGQETTYTPSPSSTTHSNHRQPTPLIIYFGSGRSVSRRWYPWQRRLGCFAPSLDSS